MPRPSASQVKCLLRWCNQDGPQPARRTPHHSRVQERHRLEDARPHLFGGLAGSRQWGSPRRRTPARRPSAAAACCRARPWACIGQLRGVMWHKTGSSQCIQTLRRRLHGTKSKAILLRKEDRVKKIGTKGLQLSVGACIKRTSVPRPRVCGAGCCQALETCKRILQWECDSFLKSMPAGAAQVSLPAARSTAPHAKAQPPAALSVTLREGE